MKRILTALALIPIVCWVVLAANQWIFLAVVAAVACLCWHEYDEIAGGYGFGRPGLAGYGAGLALLVFWDIHWLVAVAFAALALAVAMRVENLAHALPRAALLVFGVIYIFGCWKCARPLREANPHWLMYELLLNWAGDIGAYYIGKPFGKHKLAPRVSPNKSWEGSIASVAASILIAGGYLNYFIPGLPLGHVLGLTAVANVAGQLGDLAESAMKRGADLKDSGSILPGHGGILDRVDSTLFALPVIYGYLLLVQAFAK
jgi:phosphatidate cytidylyltransferase